jgi:hypothetical protein
VVEDAVVADAVAAAGLGQQVGRVGHAFHAAGHHHLRAAGQQHVVREHGRAHARAAHLAQGDGAGALGQAALETGLARRGLALAGHQAVAEDHFVHLSGLDAGALDRGLDGRAAQVMAASEAKSPWKLPMGVRAALTITMESLISGPFSQIFFMQHSSFRGPGVKPNGRGRIRWQPGIVKALFLTPGQRLPWPGAGSRSRNRAQTWLVSPVADRHQPQKPWPPANCGQKRRVMGRPLALLWHAKPSIRSHDSATAPPPDRGRNARKGPRACQRTAPHRQPPRSGTGPAGHALLLSKALVLFVGKHIMHMALADARLVALPEGHVQQVGMVLHEHLAHARIAQQEGPEGLGEHILGADAVPDLAAHLVLFVARRGHAAEVAVGDVLDLVVVVEHHLAVARDAEVLPQHVAGEDVGGHQVLDGVAVFDDGMLDLRLRAAQRAVGRRRCRAQHVEGFLQVDVERDHAPLDVEVLEDQLGLAVAVAVGNLQLAGRKFLKLGDQLGLEAVERGKPPRKTPACRPCGPRGRAASRAGTCRGSARAWCPFAADRSP